MKLPIDTTGITFLVATAPEPVRDFESKQHKTDETGAPLFAVQLVALGGDGAEVISVKVAGEPATLTQGSPVRVTGLVATPWSMGDRAGVSFKASGMEPATAATAASSAPSGSKAAAAGQAG
jgi:hypothetical protein